MKATENFKFYLNGKEVAEQEIRNCKENMSVTVDNLSVFYSFSPKIEEPFKFTYNRPKPMDIKPYEFFSVSLYLTYGIDNVKLAEKIYNDGKKDNLTLEYILENYSYFLTAKDYTNIEIWKKEKEVKNSAKKLKEDLEKLKGKVIFKEVSKGIYAYVETYLPVVDYEQRVDNRMRLAEKFKQAALNRIYSDGVPAVTSKVIASCYTSADETEKIKEELYSDSIKKCLTVKTFHPSFDYTTPIYAEKDKTEKLVFTTLEKELISKKQQGHLSTRHKKPAPMYLDEVLADIAEKENKKLYDGYFKNNYISEFPNEISAEKEIKEQSSSTKGVKHNKGKLPLDTMITKQFPNALEAICKATEYGHQKYILSDHYYDNFKKVEGGSQTYADAGQRHNLHKNEIDQESGLPHIYLKCWNALAELEIWIEENKTK